jgi:hypothetical protein
LGIVEVGGSAQTFGRVPPSFLLEEELHRNMAFTFYHAECMPLVQLGEWVVERLPDNLVRVQVPVENHGVIPTRIGHDQRHNISLWNTVSLEGSGLKVVAGGVVDNPKLDLVRWQEGDPGTVRLETVPGLSQVMVEFLVEGRGMARVRASAVRGGVVEISRRIP